MPGPGPIPFIRRAGRGWAVFARAPGRLPPIRTKQQLFVAQLLRRLLRIGLEKRIHVGIRRRHPIRRQTGLKRLPIALAPHTRVQKHRHAATASDRIRQPKPRPKLKTICCKCRGEIWRVDSNHSSSCAVMIQCRYRGRHAGTSAEVGK